MLRRACTRVVGGGRRRAPMAPSLVAFSSSAASGLPPKPQPPSSTPPSSASASARPRGFRRFMLARAAAGRDPEPPPLPEGTEKRSLAVRTGEVFLGLAALLVRAGRGGAEVEAKDGVVWEQRPEDVDAERRRRELTGPGFSFSAAGLLFPYHLGVAQCLIDRGYLTVRVHPPSLLPLLRERVLDFCSRRQELLLR